MAAITMTIILYRKARLHIVTISSGVSFALEYAFTKSLSIFVESERWPNAVLYLGTPHGIKPEVISVHVTFVQYIQLNWRILYDHKPS